LQWSVDLPRFTGHLTATADTVIVGGWRGYTPLAAFDLKDGALCWEGHGKAHTVLPTTIGDGVLTGSPGTTEIQLVNPRNGQEMSRWQLPEPLAESDTESLFTTTSTSRFFVRCGPRTLVGIDLPSATVHDVFRHDADLAPAAAELTTTQLWLRERRGGYLALAPTGGRLLWRVEANQPLVSRVTQTAMGFVIACADGALLCLDSTGMMTKRFPIATRITKLLPAPPAELLVLAKGTLLALPADLTHSRDTTDML
jgi:outer membrane protein assembly factor BamB